ncbi:MAG: hypothetical protein RIE59_23220 [Imperialibacter sp.]
MRYRSGLYFLIVVITIAGLISCKSNQICPAFQSTFILDDSLRMLAFSPFGPDSMPKYGPWVKKNKNGIITRDPYLVKNYNLKTVKMENQFVSISADSVTFDEDLYQDEMAATDSLAPVSTDSSGVDKPATAPPTKPAPKKYIRNYDPKDQFNEEQIFYNKLFGEVFVAPKEVPAAEDSLQVDGAATPQLDSLGNESPVEKKGLFRKRNKKPKDEALEPELPLDVADTTGTGF